MPTGFRRPRVAVTPACLQATARQFSRRDRRNKRAWPAVHIALRGPSLRSVGAKSRERRGQREQISNFHGCSRITSNTFLSLRSPRKAGCRISPSLVHSVNFTSPTSLGISQVVAFSSFTFWSKGFLWARRAASFHKVTSTPPGRSRCQHAQHRPSASWRCHVLQARATQSTCETHSTVPVAGLGRRWSSLRPPQPPPRIGSQDFGQHHLIDPSFPKTASPIDMHFVCSLIADARYLHT